MVVQYARVACQRTPDFDTYLLLWITLLTCLAGAIRIMYGEDDGTLFVAIVQDIKTVNIPSWSWGQSDMASIMIVTESEDDFEVFMVEWI